MKPAFSPSRLVGRGEVGHEARPPRRASSARGGLGEGGHVLRAGAEPPHAGVELEVDPGAAAARRRPRPRAGHGLGGPDGDLRRRGGGPRPLVRRRAGPSRASARRCRRRAGPRPRPTVATPSAARAPLERRAGDRDRPVPVAVGLDHRHQPRPAGGPGERRRRCAGSPPGRSGDGAGSRRTGGLSAEGAGEGLEHVRGDRAVAAVRPARRRGRGRPRRGGRARRGSMPLARKAATVPVSTSPVPAVASAGVPRALTRDGAAGRGDDRARRPSAPPRPRTARPARGRDAEPVGLDLGARSRPAGAPPRPAWGVMTVGAGRAGAGARGRRPGARGRRRRAPAGSATRSSSRARARSVVPPRGRGPGRGRAADRPPRLAPSPGRPTRGPRWPSAVGERRAHHLEQVRGDRAAGPPRARPRR